ncbi:hypothetical protein H2201_002589 [Coniosporium apollinis]|uniref:Myb/SANT-like domain-containing protein n=1 Tax=Coniosporium apollinis TaxID=61459 RepID=A0ABQ9P3F9_9PEZI|nr:hypothetical protein H2201_002589 [Coniosporium apollinis]
MRDSVEREQAPSPKSSASTHHDDASESIHQTYARPQEANYRGYKKRNSDIGETVDWTCEEHTLLAVALNHHDKRPYPAFDAKYIAEQFTKMFGRVITETAIESQRNRMLRPKIDDAEAPKCYRMAKQWAFNEDNVRRRWNLIIKGQPLYDNVKTRVLSSATHQGLEVYGAWGAHLFGHQPEIPAKKRGADSGRRDSLLDGGTPIKRTHSRSEATTVDERQAKNATQDGQNPLGKRYCHHHQATSPLPRPPHPRRNSSSADYRRHPRLPPRPLQESRRLLSTHARASPSPHQTHITQDRRTAQTKAGHHHHHPASARSPSPLDPVAAAQRNPIDGFVNAPTAAQVAGRYLCGRGGCEGGLDWDQGVEVRCPDCGFGILWREGTDWGKVNVLRVRREYWARVDGGGRGR